MFYLANPYVGAKLSIFVAVLTNSTAVYGCRLYRYTLTVTIKSSHRYMNPERAIKVTFLVFLSRAVTKLLNFSPACLLHNGLGLSKNGGVGLGIHLPFPSLASGAFLMH